MAAVNHTVVRKQCECPHTCTHTHRVKHVLVHMPADTHVHRLYTLRAEMMHDRWTQTHRQPLRHMHRGGFALTPRDEFQSKVFASMSKKNKSTYANLAVYT